jgi:hypothetical protein
VLGVEEDLIRPAPGEHLDEAGAWNRSPVVNTGWPARSLASIR